ncbi:hypothetical protein O1L55_31165 [Streptomyces albulus]|nr:hypothetical protein [Streptomyces noursei]
MLSARGVGLLVSGAVLYRLAVGRLLAWGWRPVRWGGAAAGARRAVGRALAGRGGFAAGLGVCVTGIAWDTSLQEHVPAHALSWVAATGDLLAYAAIPVGQLWVGPLARAYGGFRVVAVAGVVSAFAAVLPLASRAVRGCGTPGRRGWRPRARDARPVGPDAAGTGPREAQSHSPNRRMYHPLTPCVSRQYAANVAASHGK